MNYSNGFAPSANKWNAQYGHPGIYGTQGSTSVLAHVPQQRGPFVHGIRQRLNFVAILISLFVPWLLFCAMFWAMSFWLHYKNSFLCFFVTLLGFLVVVAIGIAAFDGMKRKKMGREQLAPFFVDAYSPTWLIFLFGTCLLAWLLGVLGGDVNYVQHLEPYYDVNNLNTYPNVDPALMRGQQLMDAGRVMFSSGSKLDLKRSMGFKNLDLYCVAPIVGGKDDGKTSSYDFWAVGVNCCSGNQADFHCGEFNNQRAAAGLRVMRDDHRAFFRLAVQQAEAAYAIQAQHPLFFHWMMDPIAEVNAYMDEGYKYFMLGIFTHFIFQLFLVMVACLIFSKMGQLF